jgi:hypothetical protein
MAIYLKDCRLYVYALEGPYEHKNSHVRFCARCASRILYELFCSAQRRQAINRLQHCGSPLPQHPHESTHKMAVCGLAAYKVRLVLVVGAGA